MTEILAPAGGLDSAMAAINSGADAIYLGLSQFSARSSAENFDISSLGKLLTCAHALNVRVYVAMNTLVKNRELSEFLETLVSVWNTGADAIILSDIFIGKFVHQNYPEIVLHLSTQAGICNLYGAKLAKKYGFSRVILSRETSLEDIKAIAQIIETEVFVQGALCTCFSGQCYMSSFAGGNSGNRGRCKQPCRKKYSYDRVGYETPEYRLSLSDLSVGKYIFSLMEAGVCSFKIEGRMRRPEYVAAAVNYYKSILDDKYSDKIFSDLKRTYNRGNYTHGLTFGQDKSFISSAVQGHIGEFVGTVKVVNGKYFCESNGDFVTGDSFKVLREGREIGGADFASDSFKGFYVNSACKLKNGDKLFITTDKRLNEKLLSTVKKINVNVSVKLIAGKLPEVDISGYKYCGKTAVSKAKTLPLSQAKIEECFKKTDKYPFEVSFGKIETFESFLTSAELNDLRRTAYARYFELISENNNTQYKFNCVVPTTDNSVCDKVAVICGKPDLDGADIVIYKPDDFTKIDKRAEENCFLFLPPFMTGDEIEKIKTQLGRFCGIYCDGSWGIELAEELGIPCFAGTGLNISNAIDTSLCPAKYVALSKELTDKEQKEIATEKTFALSSGAVKVMDLIYCPFGKNCKSCDRQSIYTLTDEAGRKFPVKRYKTSSCRFEVYNCVHLLSVSPMGSLLDCTLEKNPELLVKIHSNEEKTADYFKNYTRGHSFSPIL